jgi:hypothetical protein
MFVGLSSLVFGDPIPTHLLFLICYKNPPRFLFNQLNHFNQFEAAEVPHFTSTSRAGAGAGAAVFSRGCNSMPVINKPPRGTQDTFQDVFWVLIINHMN